MKTVYVITMVSVSVDGFTSIANRFFDSSESRSVFLKKHAIDFLNGITARSLCYTTEQENVAEVASYEIAAMHHSRTEEIQFVIENMQENKKVFPAVLMRYQFSQTDVMA